MRNWRIYIMVVILAAYALPLHAQTSANVPTNDPAYEWIKILAGAGLVKTDFPEQLPWSRLEFVRLIREAESYYSKKFENDDDTAESLKHYSKKFSQKYFIHQIMDALKAEFADTLNPKDGVWVAPLDRAILQYQYLGQTPQPVTAGFGSTDALFHPLINNAEGRHYLKGSSLDLQTQHRLQLGRYFSIFARIQAETTFPTGDIANSINIYPKSLAGKAGWKNIEFIIGRDQEIWGMSPHGGMVFSDNSRGLDLAQIDTPYPFHLPWIFKKLGSFKFTTLFSNFGPQYMPSNPWMTATQILWHITPSIRLGAGHELTFAGSGFPIQSPGTLFLEYLGIPTSAGNPYQGGAHTNRSYNISGSVRMPFAHNTELGLDLFIEDKSFRSAELMFRHEMAYRGWLWVPDLTGNGRWQLFADYKYVGSRPYTHGEYLSGWALNREFIAETNGPDTQTVKLGINYLISAYSKLSANIGYVRRLSNTYTFTQSTPGIDDGVVTLTSGPVEQHYLGFLGFQSSLGHGLILDVQAGLDTITNNQFLPGNTIHPALLKANLSWYPYLRAQ